ncbi:MAG: hypothetical protein RLY14_2085 [Planctomycetota bacterium]
MPRPFGCKAPLACLFGIQYDPGAKISFVAMREHGYENWTAYFWWSTHFDVLIQSLTLVGIDCGDIGLENV